MKKTALIVLWLMFTIFYMIVGLENIDFIPLRINIWVQMTIVALVLSSTGAILQILLQNPIADPWLLGVTGASSLGTVIAGLLQLTPILFWRTSYSLIGSILSIVFLLFIAKKSTSFSMSRFVLIGLGINSFCSALIVFLQSFFAPNNFYTSLVRISGHFVSRSLLELALVFSAFILMVVYLLFRQKELSILSSGEDLASAVGVETHKIKTEAIVVCAIALAIVVSIAGSIGFIGLATPHIIKKLFGEKESLNPDFLVPVSGILIVIAGITIRLLPQGVFVPIGTAMSLIGAPIFIYILLQDNQVRD